MQEGGKKRLKKMSQHGSKSHAGTILCTLFRAIGDEKTEMVTVKVPGKDGQVKPMLVTKAEALVRDCFDMAMPAGQQSGDESLVDPKTRMEYRKLIFERMAGKAGDAKNEGKECVADRVSDLNRERMNNMAMNTGESSGEKKTKKKVPQIPRVPVCKSGRE